MSNAGIAAVVTWFQAAGFGLSTVPVSLYLLRHGTLPTFMGLFEAYGGPWSAWMPHTTFVALLMAFLVVSGVGAWSGWLLWSGSQSGAVLNLALIPIEAIFWIGFALPIPWALGIVRAVLIVLGWKSLT